MGGFHTAFLYAHVTCHVYLRSLYLQITRPDDGLELLHAGTYSISPTHTRPSSCETVLLDPDPDPGLPLSRATQRLSGSATVQP